MSECGIHAFSALHGELQLCFSDVTGLKAARLERRILHCQRWRRRRRRQRRQRRARLRLRLRCSIASAQCVVVCVRRLIDVLRRLCVYGAIRRDFDKCLYTHRTRSKGGLGSDGRCARESRDRKGRTPLTPSTTTVTPNPTLFLFA